MPRIRQIILIIIPATLLPIIFIYDVTRSAVNFEVISLSIIREIFVVFTFGLICLFVISHYREQRKNATKEIGKILFALLFSLLLIAVSALIQPTVAQGRESLSINQSIVSILISTILTAMLVTLTMYLLLIILDLILFKRKRNTKKYYYAYIILLSLTCIAELSFIKKEIGFISTVLFSLSILAIIFNSFRQNWIVYLSKREKIYSIIFSVLLFISLTILNLFLTQNSITNSKLIAYSGLLHSFIQLNALFGAVYFGVTFVSALFHLPTAEVFERKQSELSSLHNLSRLVTQVFDFNDLVNTVTQMTTEVCAANSVWLELFFIDENTGEINVEISAKKNISQQKIDLISDNSAIQLRHYLLDTKKVLLVDDIWSDYRTKNLKDKGFSGSLLTVPLLSHGKLIGVLNATKDYKNAFDQDDIEVMTTFADHVSIAIENSRLIAKSIERERLHQEMMVAQRMQKRLLPQYLPTLPSVEFSAASESSFEVGGDYYDIIDLSKNKFGIVVGDVSGKGVSAAFYMAEVKGIVLALSKISKTPKELLTGANEALKESLDKNAFISAMYAVLDANEETLTLARAGHCPALFISQDKAEFVRPNGIGLGLTKRNQFENAIEERKIKLKKGDVFVFYTDGITEARNSMMEEYGYDRLLKIAMESKEYPADVIKDRIINNVRTFISMGSYNDDITIIILKWLGN